MDLVIGFLGGILISHTISCQKGGAKLIEARHRAQKKVNERRDKRLRELKKMRITQPEVHTEISGESERESESESESERESESESESERESEQETWYSARSEEEVSEKEDHCISYQLPREYQHSISRDILKEYIIISKLGTPGKDGIVLCVYSTKDKRQYAMKVFKKGKSLKNIKQEIFFQKKAARHGLAPPIIWDTPDEKNRLFIMEKMSDTLESVLRTQRGTLTKAQTKQIIVLVRRLDDIHILHNDENIGKNMMVNSSGHFYFIDFGFSKKIKKNTQTNMGLLTVIDRLLKKPVFHNVVSKEEKKTGKTIDVRKKVRDAMKDRIKQRIKELKR